MPCVITGLMSGLLSALPGWFMELEIDVKYWIQDPLAEPQLGLRLTFFG